MKKALIITVGTTPDPIIKSIKGNDVEVIYLVYGRPLTPDQEPNPFNVAHHVKSVAEKDGKQVMPIEIDDPEDIDSCVSKFRELTKQLQKFDEIIVNFTGGTKPMSAAAFHIFLTEMIPSKLIFEYVGGKFRNEYGRVARMEIKKTYKTASEELARKVISYMKEHQFYLAKKISEPLPEKRYRFLKKAADAFWLWDSFEYEDAVRILNEIGKAAESLENTAFDPVPENVVKLRNVGNIAVEALRKMKRCQNGNIVKDIENCYILALDTIVNAERRLFTHNYSEAVLRAYRAIEITTQVKLLENRINPWKVEWANVPGYKDILKILGYKDVSNAPNRLTLKSGLYVLDFLRKGLMDKIKNDLQFIAQIRNYSKLEHGYSSVSKDNAENSIKKAIEIIKIIKGSDFTLTIDDIRIFWR